MARPAISPPSTSVRSDPTRVRVASYGDIGPTLSHEWAALNGRIVVPTWPLDRPDACVHFEFFGVIDGHSRTCTGTFDPSP
jgi:hypothetical protein